MSKAVWKILAFISFIITIYFASAQFFILTQLIPRYVWAIETLVLQVEHYRGAPM